MAHYRKIDVAIWNDDKFSKLSINGKVSFLFLLTHPNMTGVGAMRATVQGLSAELGVSTKSFDDVFASGLAVCSHEENAVFVPNFVNYQGAESLNSVKGWAKQFEYVPHGEIKGMAIQAVYGYALAKGEAFVKALEDAYLKAYGKPITDALPLGYPYPVSSKQLAVSSIKTSHGREPVMVNGRWHESDTGAEVAHV